MSTVVFSFGRMNPPTIGHEKLVDKVRSVARLESGDPFVYLSHSQDKNKNPLDYLDKIKFAQSAFGKIMVRSKSNTITKVMQELEKKYSDVILVVGSDRVEGMRDLLEKYNGKDYNFNSIKVVSAGERDADADDVSGMSASKMREAVTVTDDVDATWVDSKGKKQPSFRKGLPSRLQSKAQIVMDLIRKGMKL